MSGSSAYSFMDINASMVGPGGAIAFGNGSGAAEEGISVEPTGDIGQMTVGADGVGMHSLFADKSGSVTVRLLKNSPINEQLAQMYAFQTSASTAYGGNTIVIRDKARGDVITCTQCAFKKAPPINYAKVGDAIVWEFHAVAINRTLGS
jgi:hypothetical protein